MENSAHGYSEGSEEAPKKKAKLKAGYYWVKNFNDQWFIAQYLHRGLWIQCGHDSYFTKENFTEIDVNPIERK